MAVRLPEDEAREVLLQLDEMALHKPEVQVEVMQAYSLVRMIKMFGDRRTSVEELHATPSRAELSYTHPTSG